MRPIAAATPSPLRRFGAVTVGAVIAGLVLAALGLFGSYLNAGPMRRIGYWVGAMLVGSVLYGGASIVAAMVRGGGRTRWAALIGAALVASIPQAIITRAAALWLWPELRPVAPSPGLWFGQTAMMGLGLTIGAALVRRRATAVAPSETAEIAAPSSASPQAFGEGVLALQMEDHYVRLHRAAGSTLHLMPMARAIDRVAGDGLRVHRSWWVAADAVAGHEGDARRLRLRLINGLLVPVARSAVIHVRSRGWLSEPPASAPPWKSPAGSPQGGA